MSQRRIVIETFDNYSEAFSAKQDIDDGNTYQIRKMSKGFALVRREVTKPSNPDNPKTEGRRKKRGKRDFSWEGEF
jgi:hypothetical protein